MAPDVTAGQLTEFVLAKESFNKALELANQLAKFSAPADKRQQQLHEVGNAAKAFVALPSILMEHDNEPLRQDLFAARTLYHDLFNPNNNVKQVFPSSYDALRKTTHIIQEARKTVALKKKSVKAKAAESDDEVSIVPGPANFRMHPGAPIVKIVIQSLSNSLGQMQVDDEGAIPRDLHFKKNKHPDSAIGNETPKEKSKKKKRRLDFDENAFIQEGEPFLIAPVKNLSSGPSANFIVDEAKLISTQPTEFLNTVPAIKKRLYQLMVEVAVINEKIKSELGIRAVHVEDAAELTERLQELQAEIPTEASGSNL
ncbi:hypothetical protein C8R43DRAFT_1123050 [Mycena crocata]|nr:hypothetical protein C8R43DRAFT_1123050 [Mycena crocata]